MRLCTTSRFVCLVSIPFGRPINLICVVRLHLYNGNQQPTKLFHLVTSPSLEPWLTPHFYFNSTFIAIHLFISIRLWWKVSGVLHNTGQSLVFRPDTGPKHSLAVNVSAGPLAYRYQIEEVFLHYGTDNSHGSEHRIQGNAFPAEVSGLIDINFIIRSSGMQMKFKIWKWTAIFFSNIARAHTRVLSS